MKLLIAFAVIAVAFADEVRVVTLPKAPAPAYEVPNIRLQPIILNPIKIGEPILRAAPVNDLTVRFVDAAPAQPIDAVRIAVPTMVAQEPAVAEDLKVRFVDAPLEVLTVRFVDAAPAQAVEPVKVVAPVFKDEDLKVRFVDTPVEDWSARLPAPAVPEIMERVAEDGAAVKVAQYLRPKQFENPLLRNIKV